MSRITVTMDEALTAQILLLAESEDRSKTNMIRILLREALGARAPAAEAPVDGVEVEAEHEHGWD